MSAHGHRRRASISDFLPVILLGAAVGVAAGLAGYLVQSSRREELTNAAADAGATAPAPAPELPELGIVPQVASSPPPVYTGSEPRLPSMTPAPAPMAAPALAAAVQPQPAGVRATPADAGEAAVRSDGRFSSLLAAPTAFIARRTLFISPGALSAFLADRRRTERYLSHPLIAGVLGSPELVRALLRPEVARAFVTSPAMRDSATVKRLAGSALMRGILGAAGVRQALATPGVLDALKAEPATADWLRRNPSVGPSIGLALAGR